MATGVGRDQSAYTILAKVSSSSLKVQLLALRGYSATLRVPNQLLEEQGLEVLTEHDL